MLPALPGLTFYTYPHVVLFADGVGGTPGVAGTGTLDIAIPLAPGLQGVQVWFQHYVLDGAAPSSFVHTNGLEFTIGS